MLLRRRLAEAFAEKLHELVRKELWGYAPEENLSGEDLLKVKYQVRGLRMSQEVMASNFEISATVPSTCRSVIVHSCMLQQQSHAFITSGSGAVRFPFFVVHSGGCDDSASCNLPQGIRPAPGYPSQPDHQEKATMWDLLKTEEAIGMEVSTALALTLRFWLESTPQSTLISRELEFNTLEQSVSRGSLLSLSSWCYCVNPSAAHGVFRDDSRCRRQRPVLRRRRQ